MPFTLSHPAVALLLRGTGLPVAATVAGTMAPDLPLFLPRTVGYSLTHSLLGIVTVDLAVSLVGVAVWFWLVRDALVDTAPAFVRERLPATAQYSPRQWAFVPIAAVLGSLTHVGWDELTHAGRWGTRHVGWLRSEHLGYLGYHWTQAVSTFAGLGVVLAWSASAIVGRRRDCRAARVPRIAAFGGWAVLSIVVLASGAAALSRYSDGLHAMAFTGAVVGTIALVGSLVAVALAWQLLGGRGPSRPPPAFTPPAA